MHWPSRTSRRYDNIGRSFESRVSRPAVAEGLPADFAKVDAAQQAFIGEFEDANAANR
jgi:hypothetical protein